MGWFTRDKKEDTVVAVGSDPSDEIDSLKALIVAQNDFLDKKHYFFSEWANIFYHMGNSEMKELVEKWKKVHEIHENTFDAMITNLESEEKSISKKIISLIESPDIGNKKISLLQIKGKYFPNNINRQFTAELIAKNDYAAQVDSYFQQGKDAQPTILLREIAAILDAWKKSNLELLDEIGKIKS